MLARLGFVAALAACATTDTRVRDIDGTPLPSSAKLDADMPPVTVWCGNERYEIVEAPHPYLAGTHLATHQVHVRDAAALCAKITSW